MVEKEEFRDIKGYEGHYQVSNFGRVKSLKRYHGKDSRILKQHLDGSGYFVVGFFLDGVRKNHRVHQLVAAAFLGHTKRGRRIVINHKDGDKGNNHSTNLEIVTFRQNLSSGCFRKDSHNFSSKYTGVYWNKKANKWQAYINFNWKMKYLGLFENEIDAYEAYQAALKEHLQNNQIKK